MGAANLDQDQFRFRDNDGSETGATWRQLANTNDTLGVDTTYRLRFMVEEYNGGSKGNVDFEFQYNLNAAGWNNITAVSYTHLTLPTILRV